jgi:hypothetical protein
MLVAPSEGAKVAAPGGARAPGLWTEKLTNRTAPHCGKKRERDGIGQRPVKLR